MRLTCLDNCPLEATASGRIANADLSPQFTVAGLHLSNMTCNTSIVTYQLSYLRQRMDYAYLKKGVKMWLQYLHCHLPVELSAPTHGLCIPQEGCKDVVAILAYAVVEQTLACKTAYQLALIR